MMFGEIGGWFFKSIGGILPDPTQPGFKHILLKPIFPEGLDDSEISHESPYGTIVSKWKKVKSEIVYDVTIPANSSATFYAPNNVGGQREIKLSAGTHQLKLKLR